MAFDIGLFSGVHIDILPQVGRDSGQQLRRLLGFGVQRPAQERHGGVAGLRPGLARADRWKTAVR